MTTSPEAERSQEERRARSRRRSFVWIVILIVILILLWLLRGCRPVERFDYFRAKSAELGNDPGRVLAYVKELPALGYRGDAQGPLATLWNGAGSPEEKKALAEALLAVRSARAVALDEVAPDRAKEGDAPSPAKPCELTVTHRALAADGTARETVVAKAPTGAFVGDVHSVEFPGEGRTRLTFRLRRETTRERAAEVKDVDSKGAVAEELAFAVERPGEAEPLRFTRELWHRDNRVGATSAALADRHDLVVLPARTGTYVREKEELVLKEASRLEAREAKPYLTLLDYAVRSDKLLLQLEKQKAVRARFEVPRVLVLSSYAAPSYPGGTAQAFDLRWNRTGWDGDPIAAYAATEVRSFAEAGLEQQFLAERSKLPVTSTFDVFTRLKDELPSNPTRRLGLIRRTLESVATGALDGSARFVARDPRGTKREGALGVTATRESTGGVHLRGGPVTPAFAKALADSPDARGAEGRPALKIGYAPDGKLDAVFVDLDDAAVAVEATLLAAATKPAVDVSYVLDVALERGTEPLVVDGAVFDWTWGEGEARTDQRVRVIDQDNGDLAFAWRVQTGALPVAGKRRIAAAALDSALVHNPWYRSGSATQQDATSFVVSRKAHAALKAGRATEFALWAKLAPDEDEKADRKLSWKGSLEPLGAGSATVLVNGRPVKLPLLRARLEGTEVSVLDDPAFPVGLADRLVRVSTAVRGKLLDERGLGIEGANVRVKREPPSKALPTATTGPDGAFRLPPAPSGSYGPVTLTVTVGELPPVEVAADLTAPGLDVVEVKVPRPRPELAWITDANAAVLEELPLSDQVKRHAKRDVAAGRLVVIPTRMVSDGIGKVIGYFACERDTGYLVGVTEDGLNGSDAWSRAIESAAKSVKDAEKSPEAGASAPLHMLRGAIVAYWTYSSSRLEGKGHKEAIIATLEAMDGWADSLDITHFAGEALKKATAGGPGGDALGDKLAGKLSELVGQGLVKTDDDAAKAAFKIGYMGATLFLAKALEDSDG